MFLASEYVKVYATLALATDENNRLIAINNLIMIVMVWFMFSQK